MSPTVPIVRYVPFFSLFVNSEYWVLGSMSPNTLPPSSSHHSPHSSINLSINLRSDGEMLGFAMIARGSKRTLFRDMEPPALFIAISVLVSTTQ